MPATTTWACGHGDIPSAVASQRAVTSVQLTGS